MDRIGINTDKEYNLSTFDKNVSFEVERNKQVYLLLEKIAAADSVEINILDNAELHLSILADEEIKNMNLTANLGKNSQLIVYFADFSIGENKLFANINLNEENAKVEWHLASLSGQKDRKELSVSVLHNKPQTYARVDNYGVAKDDSRLVFSGTSHILHGSIKTKTQQNAKIMVFDEFSDAVAKPILKIDENDIEASHSAAVGKISDEHLFYLTSRGLTMEEARTIITLGYLKPIFKGFNEEKIDYMNEIIGGRL